MAEGDAVSSFLLPTFGKSKALGLTTNESPAFGEEAMQENCPWYF